tara:strand:+ start:1823 stop:2197 length:375 start_codon:yes stop_codon:yes gene_type:complete
MSKLISGLSVCLREKGAGFYGETEGRLTDTHEPFLLSVAYVPRINDQGQERVDGFASVGFPPRAGTKWGEEAMGNAPVLEFKTSSGTVSETLDVVREFLRRKLDQDVMIISEHVGGKERDHGVD